MSEHKPTTVGAAVAAWGEAISLVDQVYQADEGATDEGTEAVERLAERLGENALEQLSRFIRFCEAQDAAQDVEIERAKKAKARIEARRSWAERASLAILGDAKKRTAGPFLVKKRLGSERICRAADLDLDSLPPELVRETPEKVTPASKALDKAAAKKYLKDEKNLPIPKVWIERGPNSIKID